MSIPNTVAGAKDHLTGLRFDVSSNASIERTPSGMLRMPKVAAHVKR